jgi:preprotein translocase subunit SecD
MKSMLSFLAVLLLVNSPSFAQEAKPAATFSLTSADVPKVVIFMYAGGKCWLEVTYNKDKQAEFAALATDNIGKSIAIMLNGKSFGERTLKDANVGHSIKVDAASPEEAFATAKALLKQ